MKSNSGIGAGGADGKWESPLDRVKKIQSAVSGVSQVRVSFEVMGWPHRNIDVIETMVFLCMSLSLQLDVGSRYHLHAS